MYNESINGESITINKVKFLDYQFFQNMKKEEIEEFYFLLCERNLRIVLPLSSKYANKRIENIINIIDFKDTSIVSLFTKVNWSSSH